MFKLKKSILIISMILLVLISITTVTATDITADTNTDTVLENTDEIELDVTSNNNGSLQENIATNDSLANNEEKITNLPANINPNDNNSFTALDSLINKTEAGGILTLEHDYIMYIDEANTYATGITINKDITINTNGYTINANKTGRIFNVIGDLTLINGKFINAENSAIYSKGAVRIANSTFTNNHAYNGGVIFHNGTSFTITDSIFINNNATNCGGVIFNYGANFTIVNSTFIGNNPAYGGIMYNAGDNFTIINSTFNNNDAILGGVIYNIGNGFNIFNSIFTNNYVTNSNYTEGNGGVIVNVGDNFTIINSTFTNNTAQGGGGVIYNNGGEYFTVINSTFIANSATNNTGGVIHTQFGANFTVINSTFTNTTGNNGSVIYNIGGANLTIINSTFTNNNATDGGIIYNQYSANFNIINSSFSNNTVKAGDIIYNNDVNFTIINSTFADNVARNRGGVIYNIGARFTVVNSTFSGNNARNRGGVIYNNGTNPTVVNSTFIGNHDVIGVSNVYQNCILTILVNNQSKIIVNPDEDLKLTAKLIDICNNTYYSSGLTYEIYNETGLVENITADNLFNAITKLNGFYNISANYSDPGHTITNYTIINATVEKYANDSFTALEVLINNTDEGNVLNLAHNYIMYANEVNTYENGIIINKTITINANGYTIDANKTGRIFNVTGNLTLTNGKFTNGKTSDNGGVIYSIGSVTIINSTFTNNNASNGGVIENYGDKFTIINSTFTNNNATDGGVIENYGDKFTIINSTFTNNTATDGGAIYNKGSNFKVVNSTFTNNNAIGEGGVIVSYYGNDFTVINSTFTNNSADMYSGVIYNTGSCYNFTVIDSTFIDNNAKSKGGVIENYGNNFTIINSTFTNNNAIDYGSVIYNRGANCTVVNSIFNDNIAKNEGGVIYNKGTNFTVIDSTFTNNTATNGGVIYNEGNTKLNVINSIFINNNAKNGKGGAIYLDTSNAIISNSKFYNNTAGDYAGAIFVNGNNNLISNCDFKYNNAPKGTVIGVYKGYNLAIVNSTNVDNSAIAKIFLVTNETSLANVEVVVLDNSTINIVKGSLINLTAMVYCDGLTVAGGNLTFFDGVNYYSAESLANGTYISQYLVDYTNTRTIDAEFSNALNVNVQTGAINGYALILNVNDVIMYYKNGSSVEALLTYNDQPVAGENITISINGAQYTLTTDDNGCVSLPVGLASGKYDIISIYNGTYGYTSTNSNLTVLSTIIGEDTVLYYRNGTNYIVKALDGQGNALIGVTVRMNINGVYYNRVTDSNGNAYLPIGLNAGSYIITAENPVNGEKTSNNVTVLATMTGEDVAIYHRNGSGYSVKVVDGQGNALIGATVKMNINGVFYNVVTDNDGIATLKIGLSPGDYIITAEYNGFKTSNKITVLPVLIGSDITLHYRDGTKYTVKVLDGQGNALIGATVKMNINGVFYNVVTDNSGVASLPIGLLPGTYIITTTYNDHVTSNIVTVLK